jgi:hypothetical protein
MRRLLLLAGVALALTAPAANAAKVETIATGLDNPRHLAFGGHALFVMEAGRGGEGPCFPSPEGGTACVGDSGAVTMVTRHGQRRVVEGLASFADEETGNGAIGPHGIDISRKGFFITNGGPTGANRDELAAQNPVADLFGRVLGVRRHGRIVRLVDVWDFERDNNPDGEVGNPAIDSNAVDVLADHGRLVIADAGANTLLRTRRNGSLRVLHVFPNTPPEPDGMQAVPTGVVKGPRGDYFMSQLTGFPFPVGGASVYRVDDRTGDAEVFASGFTNIMDLAFDKHGTLWVLEIDHDSLLTPTPDGAIFAVDRKGNKRQLELDPGTLTHPGGITVGRDGALYVTNHGDTAGNGEVLRIKVRRGGHHHGHRGRHHGHHHGGRNDRPY